MESTSALAHRPNCLPLACFSYFFGPLAGNRMSVDEEPCDLEGGQPNLFSRRPRSIHRVIEELGGTAVQEVADS